MNNKQLSLHVKEKKRPTASVRSLLLEKDVESIWREIERLHSQFEKLAQRIESDHKWLIGATLTIAVAILGLVVTAIARL